MSSVWASLTTMGIVVAGEWLSNCDAGLSAAMQGTVQKSCAIGTRSKILSVESALGSQLHSGMVSAFVAPAVAVGSPQRSSARMHCERPGLFGGGQ